MPFDKLAWQKGYQQRNREKIAARMRVYHLRTKEKRNVASREWKMANPERVKETQRVYQVKIRAKRAEYRRNRRRVVPTEHLLQNLRSRLTSALKNKGRKSARTVELLGCPVCWLEAHLESLFKPGMTWENYGSMWHVDHIKPCASFDLTRPEHQRWCFHWTNLQPLFAEENLRKGAN